MDSREAMEIITKWLDPLVGGKGFVRSEESKYESDYFIRAIPDGRQSIGVAIWDYQPLVEVALVVSVRFHPVESVFHLFLDTPSEYQGLSSTIVTPFNYFAGGPSRIKAHEAEELLAVLATWEQPLLAEAVPYLDATINVSTLDTLINVKNDILDITNPPLSFIHHIIVAKLASNPNYNKLISFHKAEMRDMGYETDLYDRLVDYLNS